LFWNGDGLDAALLAEDQPCDAMLAVTDDDKTNMLACVRAKAEGCPYVIALINDPTLVPLENRWALTLYQSTYRFSFADATSAMGVRVSIPSATLRPPLKWKYFQPRRLQARRSTILIFLKVR
jgi:hypothetical protein